MNNQLTPRRALPDQQQNNNKTALIAGITSLAVLAITGGAYALSRPDSPAAATVTNSAASSHTTTCPDVATVAVDPAWNMAVEQASRAWAKSLGQGCEPIIVRKVSSAEAAAGGIGDDAGWVPEDPVWQSMTKQASLRDGVTTTVGSSPLVLVNTPEAAEAFGEPMQGKALAEMLAAKKTWADHGHADWGRMKLVLPNPRQSVAGAIAFGSLSQQAAPLAPKDGLAGAEMGIAQQRIVETPDFDQVTNLLAANPADANGLTAAGPRTGVTTETIALKVPDVKASLVDGRSGIRLSLVNTTTNRTLTDFASWLSNEEGQKYLAEAGVRAGSHMPSEEQLKSIGLPAAQGAVAAASAEAVGQAQGLFAATSKRSAAMLVLDTSGSMAYELPGAPGTRKIDLILNMALQGWSKWPPGMATGLITFSSTNDASEKPLINTVVPLMRNDSVAWVQASKQYQAAMGQMQVTGGTPLYQAIEFAYKYQTENYVDGMDNTLVIVTDGRSEDAAGEPSLQQLLSKLPAKPDATKPIKVIYVGLGPDADIATLRTIAQRTGQQAVQVNSMAELASAMKILFKP